MKLALLKSMTVAALSAEYPHQAQALARAQALALPGSPSLCEHHLLHPSPEHLSPLDVRDSIPNRA